ncbi:MAG: energy-converting hydrogenase B subunit D [Shewanella psychromarinicola]|jgi:energy-converting hydrogenase B subunit D
MNLMTIFDALLILSILTLGWMSIFSISLFRCIVFFVCLGLLATIVWGQLGAFDVAIAEAAIGAGITGALLLAAWNRIRPRHKKEVDPGPASAKINPSDTKEHV